MILTEAIVLCSLHPDVVIPTFCGAVRSAKEEAFWNIRKLLASATRSDVRQAILLAMARCQPDEQLVKR